MRRFFIWLLVLLIMFAVGAFVAYKFYLPTMVANVFTKDEEPVFIPKFVKARLQKYKAPVNKGAEDVIREIHRSNISLDELLEAIDETKEEQVYGMLDEVNQLKPKTPNQIFDIAKKHFNPDFDVEVLRKPFNENVTMEMIKQGIAQANVYRNQEGIDPEMAKSIAKQILIQKEKEYNKAMGNR